MKVGYVVASDAQRRRHAIGMEATYDERGRRGAVASAILRLMRTRLRTISCRRSVAPGGCEVIARPKRQA